VLQVDWSARTSPGSPSAGTVQAGARKTPIPPDLQPRLGSVLFTSDKTGKRAVYCVPVPEKLQVEPRP